MQALTHFPAGFTDSGASETIERAPRIRILRKLGHGRMGQVYLARVLGFKGPVALKRANSVAGEHAIVHEADILRSVQMPGVCGFKGSLRVGAYWALCLEYISGESLLSLLDRDRLCKLEDAVSFIAHLAETLAACHARGVLHGDVKPANIMISAGGQPILIDFGLSRYVGERADMSGRRPLAGSPGYLPPELIAGEVQQLTIAGEIYSLGVVLYELLSGQRLFAHDIQAVLRHALVQAVVPQLPPECEAPPKLVALCRSMLARNPAERPISMMEVRRKLDEIGVY